MGASKGGDDAKGGPAYKALASRGPSEAGAAASVLPAVGYGLMNLFSVVAIVVANKQVMSTYHFKFPVCLTMLHAVVTAAGMQGMAWMGVFEVKRLPVAKTLPIACAYAAFICFSNLSIQVNTVGFYQISKIAITPVVVAVEYLLYGREVTRQKAAAVAVVVAGIALATVTDSQVSSNLLGVLVAGVSIASSVMYTVWAGSSQKTLDVSANQLLHQVAPLAVALLALLTPLLEPVGLRAPRGPGTVLGTLAGFTPVAAVWMALSCCLGLLVSLSTYLFIGVTSATSYSVVGHLKTVCIVASGVVFFHDSLGPKKLLGLCFAMVGIVWYTGSSSAPSKPPPPPLVRSRTPTGPGGQQHQQGDQAV